MSYTQETREEFFREEWDECVRQMHDVVNGTMALPEPGNDYDLMLLMDGTRKLALCVKYLTGIICDDQAEIASLKAIAKAKGAH